MDVSGWTLISLNASLMSKLVVDELSFLTLLQSANGKHMKTHKLYLNIK